MYSTSTNTKTYVYDASGQILKISSNPEMDVVYTWSGSKIIKSETTVEENGKVLVYTLSYEFRSDVRVSKRMASNGSTTESAQYLYY